MSITKWVKPYKGPFKEEEAKAVADDLRKTAKPDVNGIYDARVRVRNYEKGEYDVYIKTLKWR